MAFQFLMPAKILVGEGALDQAVPVWKQMGTKALIVTDQSMVTLGNVARLEQLLKEAGIVSVVYPDINGEPTDVMIEAGLALYQAEHCDFLIGLGGGSPLDSMKAIGALATNGGKITDYMGREIEKAAPPMTAIPTTAGTGSEATQFTIISDTKRNIKMLLKGRVLIPDLAIVDPQFTLSAPKNITASTGMDAFTHAVEAYTSKKATKLSDTFAVSAIKRIVKNLPIVYKDGTDQEAREEMAIAALEAGIAFNNASVTVVHGMSRPIGALFHVPHGISNAMLDEVCFAYVLDGAYDRFGQLAREIGAAGLSDEDHQAAEKFLETVRALCRVCEIPTLKEYGIDQEEFFRNLDKMAGDAMESGSPSNTRKTLYKEDLIQIYKSLWE
ncbi:MAG: iron-containing alcohol dehydrogenase [Lachnospiraceae bacterium]